MENKLFSPIFSAANNILGSKRTLTKRAKDYESFITFLETSNKELSKIKLPTKKKVERLALGGGGLFGGGGGGGELLGNLLGGAGSLGAGLGLRKLFKGKFGGGKFKGNYEDIIKNLYKKTNLTKGEKFSLRDYERLAGKGGISNESAAFRSLLRNKHMNEYKFLTGHGKGVMGGGFSAETAAQYRQAGKNEGGGFRESPRGRLGGIGGALNVAFAGLDFIGRKGEGQSNLQAGAGAAGGALGGIAGAEAGAAAGAAIGSLFGGVGAVPGAIIGGLIGGFGGGQLGGNIADKLTGADKMGARLKEQEKKQREAATTKITFSDIVNKFDKVVSKFEKFVKGFGGPGQQQKEQPTGYDEELSADEQPTPPGKTGEQTASISYGSGNAEFGETGNVHNSAGWVHGHFQGSNSGSVVRDTAMVVKALLQQGSPVYLNPGVDLVPGKKYSDEEIRNYVEGARAAHTHSGTGKSIDVFVRKGTKVPVSLTQVGPTGTDYGGYGRGGIAGFIQGTDTWIGHLSPNSKTGLAQKKGEIKGTEAPNIDLEKQNQKVNTITKQQSIEDFIEGTKEGDRILKDPKLKAQLTGKKYQYRASMTKTPVTDLEVKKVIRNYNDYVRNIRQARKDQAKVEPQARPQLPVEIASPPPSAEAGSSLVVVNNTSSPETSQSQSGIIPIPIPMGGGGGGSSVGGSGLSAGEVVNSFAKLILLTNLSGS